MSLALQVLVSGLAAGGVYGLFAVGHALAYRLTGVVHLALGDLVSLAVFATLFVAVGTGPVTESSGGARLADVPAEDEPCAEQALPADSAAQFASVERGRSIICGPAG